MTTNTLNTTEANSSNQMKGFFDSRLSGFAYLQRAREVEPKKGEPYMAVTVAIMQGKVGSNENTLYVDCNIVGTEATQLVRDNMDAINNKGVKVSARAIASDFYVEPFIYAETHKTKAGQAGAMLKGRLLKLTAFKVNGQLVESTQSKVHSAEFGTAHWPTSKAVKLDANDADYQTKLELLQKYQYEFNQANGYFVATSESSIELLNARRETYVAELEAAQQPQDKVVNG